MKDERFNDTWHRSFANQARAQDVADVLDRDYVPPNDEQKELFHEKKKYLYAVLESKVLTESGKAIVRKYEKTYDAQAVYKDLTEAHLRSTKAKISSSDILSYITTAHLGTGLWKGTTEQFIIHWQEQVRLYERQVPETDHFSNGQKKTMLENAVSSVNDLRQVKTNADLEQTKTGHDITYDQYTSLLLSAATSYDKESGSQQRRQRRAVYAHDIIDDGYDFEDKTGKGYDIDSPLYVIQANATAQRPVLRRGTDQSRRVRMSFDRWRELDQDSRHIWDQLDNKAKASILGLQHQPSSSGGNTGLQNPTRRVNLHAISAHDLLQSYLTETAGHADEKQDCEGDGYNQESTETTDVEDPAPPDLLINAAKSSTRLHPGDIHRVLLFSVQTRQFQVQGVYNGPQLCLPGLC